MTGVGKRLRLIAFSALVAGIVFRTVPLALNADIPYTTCDGRAYHNIAVSLAEGRGLEVTDPTLQTVCYDQVPVGPSHHYAPGLPIVEAAFVAALGDTPLALYLPLVLLSVMAVAVVWLTTRDLFGADSALLVAAAFSLDSTAVAYGTYMGYAENLVLIASTVMLWAVLKSRDDERLVVVAGLAAGVGYLAKSSPVWFLLIGAGLVVYRWRWLGPRVLRSRSTWLGLTAFLVPVAVWSYRNIALFWDGTPGGLLRAWQTSGAQSAMLATALGQPGELLAGMLVTLPMLLALAAVPYLPFVPAIREAARLWREELASWSWLAIGLIFVTGWFLAAVFWVTAHSSPLWADPIRYVMPATIPLLWLVVRYGRHTVRAWSASFAILLVLALLPPALLLQR
jgi:4-amino-4-deoxy-L-arabinose transferase-like glycosyltransferase